MPRRKVEDTENQCDDDCPNRRRPHSGNKTSLATTTRWDEIRQGGANPGQKTCLLDAWWEYESELA